MKTALLRILVFLLIVTCTKVGIAQEQETNKGFNTFIKLNPVSLLDANYPTVQPSIELKYKTIGLVYKYGPAVNLLSKKPNRKGELSSYKGYKQKVELRSYSIDKRSKNKRLFIAVEAFIGDFEKEKQNGQFHDTDYIYSFDYVRQKIEVKGAAIKGGMVSYLNNRFYIDASFSAGLRQHTLLHKEVKIAQAREIRFSDREWVGPPGYKYTGKPRITPHIGFDLALGYKLF